MSIGYVLEGVWTRTSLLEVSGKLFRSDSAINPDQWAVGFDVINILPGPGGKYRIINVISKTEVTCSQLARLVGAVWKTVWEKKIENPDCTVCYAGSHLDAEGDIGLEHESVLWDGGVIVTPHGWGRGHVVQLRENKETGERRYYNISVGGWWNAP